ncbi:uncharacterized protein EI90DRAFT_3057178 [Cantharellus anzutake]|uniref:uncharacterized protein n=1 Tax=Cantharellus anzutake TaxID=1750568 RepID=UPI0019047F78|nr:uncharacterized protein EI90DRAFT_3057178 [Cantharellus anzutake]KAF8331748.1 hypothetical protein EI90DRAFT_3057178 [Cantharellus anzutake]
MATALINVLLAHNVYSAPINPHNMTCFLQNVSVDCNELRNYRTMWGIIYSCLLTVFACVWTAAHPDLPYPGVGGSMFLSRVISMIISLVLPELTLGSAWVEFVTSGRISEKCEMVEGWTLTHSYFVVMGGFFDPSKGSAVGRNDLQQYPGIIENTGDTRKAAIAREEILDRSKGDGFSKFLIVLQLLWFITQYVGRWASHLHISQLETMTLAYAALCLLLYVLWWHKPVNIQFPIHVTRGSSVPPTSETNVDQPTPKTETDADPMSLVQVTNPKHTRHWETPIFIATGLIFGGIHCLAWSFPFPTRLEMILWRVSAISITVVPILVIMLMFIVGQDDVNSSPFALPGLLVFSAARIILFVLTFDSLRSSPPDLLSWSSFLPHFG